MSLSEIEKYPYAYFNGVLITADSRPDLDQWGWDDFWTPANWIYWFNRTKERYGYDVAKARFADAWDRTGLFGTEHGFWQNSGFVQFLKDNNLLDAIDSLDFYTASNLLSVGNTISGTTNTLGNVAQALSNISSGVKDSTDDPETTGTKKWGLMQWILLFAGLWILSKLLVSLRGYMPVRSNNKYSTKKAFRRY